MMEVSTRSCKYTSTDENQLGQSSSSSSSTDKKENNPAIKDDVRPTFVNHAANAWHETRRKWVGDKARRPETKVFEDPIISWSMDYEDVLLTNEPFPEPIPLPEMVDFLVDIWYEDGLYD